MSRSDTAAREPRLERYQRAAHWPLLVLALAVIPLIVLPLTVDFSPGVERAFLATDVSIWAAFAADLCLRTYLADNRVRYLTAHWFDVLVVVLPFLRVLRIVDIEWVLRALRAEHGVEKAKEDFQPSRRR